MFRRALTIAAFAAVACSDGTGPTGLNGIVSFTFTGGGGGSWSVSAAAPGPGSAGTSSNMTAGVQDAESGMTVVMAFKALGGDTGDMLIIGINRLTVGSSPVASDCDPEGDVPCSGLIFAMSFNGNGDLAGQWCTLTTGSLVISEITTTRIVGTFSGTGECYDEANDDLSVFTITNGTFNVALVSNPTA